MEKYKTIFLCSCGKLAEIEASVDIKTVLRNFLNELETRHFTHDPELIIIWKTNNTERY